MMMLVDKAWKWSASATTAVAAREPGAGLISWLLDLYLRSHELAATSQKKIQSFCYGDVIFVVPCFVSYAFPEQPWSPSIPCY